MKKNLSTILGNQIPDAKCIDDLMTIYHYEHNQKQLQKGGYLALMLDCFQYGRIIGKMEERTKKKGDKAMKKWFYCPICGQKVCIIDSERDIQGVYLKCKRCRNEIEVINTAEQSKENTDEETEN